MQTKALTQNESQPSNQYSDITEKVQQPKLTMDYFQPVFQARQIMLAEIKSFISVKFHDKLVDKLKKEQGLALKLTQAENILTQRKAQYTHVLDSQFFEQRFL